MEALASPPPPASMANRGLPDSAALPEGFVASSPAQPPASPAADAASVADEEDYKVALLDIPLLPSQFPHQEVLEELRVGSLLSIDASITMLLHNGELEEGTLEDREEYADIVNLDGDDNIGGPKHECLNQLKENETLRSKLLNLLDEFSLLKHQFADKKMLALNLEDPKAQLQQANSAYYEQNQVSLYFGQDAFWKYSEEPDTSNEDMQKMAKLIDELKKENEFLKRKYQETHIIIVQLVEERESMKKQLEKVKAQMELLETASETLQAESSADDSSSGNP